MHHLKVNDLPWGIDTHYLQLAKRILKMGRLILAARGTILPTVWQQELESINLYHFLLSLALLFHTVHHIVVVISVGSV